VDVRSDEYPRLSREILTRSPGVRDAVTGAALAFDAKRAEGYAAIDSDAWRTWAEAVKTHALGRLDHFLEEAERNLEANGATVHWAETPADVHAVLADLVGRYGVKTVVKGKSMVSEELELNPFLESIDVDVFETDLGEYILQLLHEPPSHILGPAIHRSLDDIRRLFAKRFGTAPDAEPETLAAVARATLRQAFLDADMGITGGNFVVAETGTVALIENEGNIRLTTSVPRVHVAVVGIEKILPRWDDLAGFLQLTARAATGQPIGIYVSLVQGPRQADEPDGPEHVHVIFVDNGRTRVLADPEGWEALRCVRCGACLNACPVYRQTGGHAYGWVYSGPIGSILNPGLLGLEQAHSLPFASTLCGACADVCPVRIPIPKLLLTWRQRAVEQGLTSAVERMGLEAYARVAARPRWFRRAASLLGSFRAVQRLLPLVRGWGRGRASLEPSRSSFRAMWRRGDVRGDEVERGGGE
jgi:L-lactate dehydrogenase complex protein LldF